MLVDATRIPRPQQPRARQRLAVQPKVRLGVARDEAFCFYYQDNLDLLEEAGAEVAEFSLIRDGLPDDVSGLYIGGGYPELHAEALAANRETRERIRDFALRGGPVYAECGGLMYLAASLDVEGVSFPMCNVLPFSTRIPAGLSLAYVEIETNGGLFGSGCTARGHLFHHSEIIGVPEVTRSYTLTTTWGESHEEGYQVGNVLASYAHVHFASAPVFARTFVDRCREFPG
jgi:cobyrinic acid a,c-diamide synthase